jgi:hypothetical protein
VFFEPVDENTHAIVPQLDCSIVETGSEERLAWMERKPLQAPSGSSRVSRAWKHTPFTRLLLDSNLVSITDMADVV